MVDLRPSRKEIAGSSSAFASRSNGLLSGGDKESVGPTLIRRVRASAFHRQLLDQVVDIADRARLTSGAVNRD